MDLNTVISEKDNTVYLKPLDETDCRSVLINTYLTRNLITACNNTSCPMKDISLARCISTGSVFASKMIIDSYPDEYDVHGGCFTGPKGLLLSQALANKSKSDIYCTVMIKCHDIQKMNPDIVNNCMYSYFLKELEIVHPKTIIITYSAYTACAKYNLIEINPKQQFSYFNKVKINISKVNLSNVDMIVIYDFNQVINGDERTKNSFIQGLQSIL